MSTIQRDNNVVQKPKTSSRSIEDHIGLRSSNALVRKRPRAAEDSGGDAYQVKKPAYDVKAPAPGEPSFKDMVNALDEHTVRTTLVRLASMAPSAQMSIRQAYMEQLREDHIPHRLKDYDYLSKEIWHLLHTSSTARAYRTIGCDGDVQFSYAQRTGKEVIWRVDNMFFDVLMNKAPFATKVNVLETYRKILKTVLLGGGNVEDYGWATELAGAVRQLLEEDCSELRSEYKDNILRLPKAYETITDGMCEEELLRAGRMVDEKGTLADKFKWCRDKARELDMPLFEPLDRLLELLGVPPDGQSWKWE